MEIGWIDLSQQERQYTLTVLSALQEPGSIDELGVGVVRDAFAGHFFPGTSTLLTKARYFFLTPYLMKLMEKERDKTQQRASDLRSRYQNLERQCAEGLLACEEVREGIVGRVSLPQGKWVSRGPGELYWASIRHLGFMRPYVVDSYVDYFGRLSQIRLRNDNWLAQVGDGDNDGLSDDEEPFLSAWNVPAKCWSDWNKAWSDWGNQASIALTQAEAVFMKNQILKTQPSSLFAMLLEDESIRDIALNVQGDSNDIFAETGEASFHNFLQQGGLRGIQVKSEGMAYLCQIADEFSEFVMGCRIVYNMQITGQEENGLEAWNVFEPRAQSVANGLDIDEVGTALGISDHGGFKSLRYFILDAQKAMASGEFDRLKEIIRARERYLKGARAKIGRTDMGDYGWRGGLRLPYRFNYAVSIVREIGEAGGFDA